MGIMHSTKAISGRQLSSLSRRRQRSDTNRLASRSTKENKGLWDGIDDLDRHCIRFQTVVYWKHMKLQIPRLAEACGPSRDLYGSMMEHQTGKQHMGVRKQSVSFTEAAFAYANELVARGDYPNVSAAVSGELARARVSRERDQALLEAEVQRRLALPLDQWEPVGSLEDFTADARAYLDTLEFEADSAAE
jgi:hypothetical protein